MLRYQAVWRTHVYQFGFFIFFFVLLQICFPLTSIFGMFNKFFFVTDFSGFFQVSWCFIHRSTLFDLVYMKFLTLLPSSGAYYILLNFGDFLKSFKVFWSLLKNFELFWSLLKYFKVFWTLWHLDLFNLLKSNPNYFTCFFHWNQCLTVQTWSDIASRLFWIHPSSFPSTSSVPSISKLFSVF